MQITKAVHILTLAFLVISTFIIANAASPAEATHCPSGYADTSTNACGRPKPPDCAANERPDGPLCVVTIIGNPKLPGSPTGTQFTAQGLPAQLISTFLPIILSVAGFFAVIIIVLSGIQFTTSQGNPEGAAAARNRLTYAIIGFIIILLAFAILQIINSGFLKSNIV